MGYLESYVESMGSKMQYHNNKNRTLTQEHLDQEVMISWNGPSIADADKLVKCTLECLHLEIGTFIGKAAQTGLTSTESLKL